MMIEGQPLAQDLIERGLPDRLGLVVQLRLLCQ
jgi:hypothetical protein